MPTPLRNFRADDDLWNAAQKTAAERGEESLSAVLVRALREYVSGHEHEAWQIRESPDGGHYCAACGQKIIRAPSVHEPANTETH